ncbi:MAG: nucleotide exchange factor GrpE [Nitrospirota bacterium]|jgi:molecular chaperone GrpE
MSDDQDNTNTIDNLENGSTTDAGQDGGMQAVLAAKEDECNALNEKYLRLAAEFENYKRLAQRDQREQIKFGNEQLLKELLPVVDNLERAIKAAHDKGSSAALVQGVDLTLKQLTGSLGKFGVQAVESMGKPFDPGSHQAVSQVPSDLIPSDHVLDEFQKGYRLHDRILRAAMVSVSSGPAQAGGESSETN